MSYQIELPAEWTLPKFSFLQQVSFKDHGLLLPEREEFGIIIGLEYQAGFPGFELEPGWYYYIYLDEASPGYQPHLLLCRHETELTLLQQPTEVA